MCLLEFNFNFLVLIKRKLKHQLSYFFLCSVETINDGNFHIVELLALDQSLSLSVDGGSPKIITNLSKQSTLNFDSPLYVGGKLCSKSNRSAKPCDSHHRLILKLLIPGVMAVDPYDPSLKDGQQG